MNKELISVIVPIYNAEKTIVKTLDSILSQSYTNKEIILINDMSTDDTLKEIKKFLYLENVTLINNKKNVGAAASRNKGIRICKGRFVAFIDSDDTWMTNKLECQVNFMLSNNFPISCTSYSRYINGRFEKNVIPPKIIDHKKLLSSNFIGLSTAIIDIQKTEKQYFRNLRSKEDYIYWLDILRKGFCAGGLQEVLTRYAVNKKLSHRKKLAKKQWHVFRDIEKMSRTKSLYHFCKYAAHGIYKTYL
jgi:glycosyltransferase involved in cell wall biosynthesis